MGHQTTVEQWKLNKAIKPSAQSQLPAVGRLRRACAGLACLAWLGLAWLGLACVCARDQAQLIGGLMKSIAIAGIYDRPILRTTLSRRSVSACRNCANCGPSR